MNKYIKNYESFKKSQEVNEGWIGDALKSASDAVKGFLNNITMPFKTMANDFRKGMKIGELKTRISTAMDTSLKSATDAINKTKEEQEINTIKDDFMKEIDNKIKEFSDEAMKIKESKVYSINEGVAQDTMIGASVVMGMFKDAYMKRKAEFDKLFAVAKDLNAKKAAAINAIKSTVSDFKNKIKDDKVIDEMINKYKQEHKIEGVGVGHIVLDWGDVEIEIDSLPDSKDVGLFKVLKSGSMKLLVGDLVKPNGEFKKGQVGHFTDVTRGGKVILPKYDTGILEKITAIGKEVDIYTFVVGATENNDAKELHDELSKIKDDTVKMKQVNNLVKNINDKNKMDQVAKILK